LPRAGEALVSRAGVDAAAGRSAQPSLPAGRGAAAGLRCLERRHARAARRGARLAQALSSFAVMLYLKLSGSRLSRRAPPVSACGYIRNPTFGPIEPGKETSCARL